MSDEKPLPEDKPLDKPGDRADDGQPWLTQEDLADAIRAARDAAPIFSRHWGKIGVAIAAIILAVCGAAAVGTRVGAPTPEPAPIVDPVVAAVQKLDGSVTKMGTDLASRLDTAEKGRQDDTASILSRLDKPAPPPGPGPLPSPDSPIVLPLAIGVNAGEQTTIAAVCDSDIVWIVPPQTPATTFSAGKSLVLTPKAGATTFAIGAVTDVKGKVSTPVWTVVTVGAPVPPGPGPTPTPADAFTKSVQDAWVLDGKSSKAATLASIYKLSKSADDATLTTVQQVFSQMHAAAQTAIGSDLMHVRAAIKAEADKTFATANKYDRPLDAQTRADVKTFHAKVQKALESLK